MASSNKDVSHNLTNSVQDKPRARPKPLPQNPRQTLGVSHSLLSTPTSTPKSPCFVHSNLNRSLSLSEIINRCDNELKEYSNLAETAVSVRELSKKLSMSSFHRSIRSRVILFYSYFSSMFESNNRSSSDSKYYAERYDSHETRKFTPGKSYSQISHVFNHHSPFR